MSGVKTRGYPNQAQPGTFHRDDAGATLTREAPACKCPTRIWTGTHGHALPPSDDCTQMSSPNDGVDGATREEPDGIDGYRCDGVATGVATGAAARRVAASASERCRAAAASVATCSSVRRLSSSAALAPAFASMSRSAPSAEATAAVSAAVL